MLSDGGTADSIPVRFFESIGYERNVVILTQPKGYVKKPNQLLPFYLDLLRKNRLSFRALENRHERYNETIAYIKKRTIRKSLVIRPGRPQYRCCRTSRKNWNGCTQLGRKEGEKRLAKVEKEFLADKP